MKKLFFAILILSTGLFFVPSVYSQAQNCRHASQPCGIVLDPDGTSRIFPVFNTSGWTLTQPAPPDFRRITHVGDDHHAQDWANSCGGTKGQTVFAGISGKIVYVAEASGYGNTVVIYDEETDFALRYAHLDSGSVLMDQRVVAGVTKIGKVGNTGFHLESVCRVDPGSHLHLSLYKHVTGPTARPIRNYVISGAETHFAAPFKYTTQIPLIKGNSSPAVFALFGGGLRVPVTWFVFNNQGWNFTTYEDMFVPFQILPQHYVDSLYHSDSVFFPPRDGTLVRADGDPTVFYIQDRQKHGVTAEIFNCRGFSFADVAVLSPGEVAAYPNGSLLQGCSLTTLGGIDPPQFTGSASTSSNSPSPGSLLSITATLNNKFATAGDVNVAVEIRDSANRIVAQHVAEHQNFQSNQSRNYNFNWTPTTLGQYTIGLGVFRGDWGQNYFWLNNAKSFSVVSPPPPPPPPSPSPTVNPTPNPSPSPVPTPVPSPSPSPTPSSPVIRGRITDTSGNGVAGVDIIYGVVGGRPLDAFTDNNGNYRIENVTPGSTYNLSPFKSGMYFTPRSQRLENVNGDRTANFIARSSPSPAPQILTEDDSERAASLDSVSWLRDPYPLQPIHPLVVDGVPRTMIFVSNLDLPAGESMSNSDVFVLAEDSQLTNYLLQIEYMGKVPGMSWLTQLNLKLPNQSNITGDLWLRVNFLGSISNRARVELTMPPLQFMNFVEGAPGIFGDGIVVDANAGMIDFAFEFRSPVRLGGLRDGLTVAVGVPSNMPRVHALSFTVAGEKAREGCQVSFGAGGGLTSGLPGYNFRYVNVTKEQLASFVTGANTIVPGCDFNIHDLYLKKMYLYSENAVGPDILMLDGAVIGVGQNKLPTISRP